MKILIHSLAMLCLAMAASGQTKPSALKFDEFTDKSDARFFFEDDVPFKTHVDRFIKQLKTERNKVVYIIHYKARVSTRDSSQLASTVRWQVVTQMSLREENVKVVDGGVREDATLEFWIADRNASAPQPTPTVSTSEVVNCPTISAYAESQFEKGGTVLISAYIRPQYSTNVLWKVDQGQITQGQGTLTIRVDPGDADRIRATAVVKDLPAECDASVTTVANIGRHPYLLDSFRRVVESELRGRLDTFLAELQNNPYMHGYLLAYADRNRPKSRGAMQRLLKNHFAFRRFDPGRITVVDAGFREFIEVEMYLVPPGAEVPKAAPTVDAKFFSRPKRTPRKRK